MPSSSAVEDLDITDLEAGRTSVEGLHANPSLVFTPTRDFNRAQTQNFARSPVRRAAATPARSILRALNSAVDAVGSPLRSPARPRHLTVSINDAPQEIGLLEPGEEFDEDGIEDDGNEFEEPPIVRSPAFKKGLSGSKLDDLMRRSSVSSLRDTKKWHERVKVHDYKVLRRPRLEIVGIVTLGIAAFEMDEEEVSNFVCCYCLEEGDEDLDSRKRVPEGAFAVLWDLGLGQPFCYGEKLLSDEELEMKRPHIFHYECLYDQLKYWMRQAKGSKKLNIRCPSNCRMLNLHPRSTRASRDRGLAGGQQNQIGEIPQSLQMTNRNGRGGGSQTRPYEDPASSSPPNINLNDMARANARLSVLYRLCALTHCGLADIMIPVCWWIVVFLAVNCCIIVTVATICLFVGVGVGMSVVV